MRKLAGATTPCQSKAAVTRFTRSPPAAKKVATTRMSTSARSAIGSRSDSRGDGQPALSLRADISARSTCARQSACATGSCWLAAISSATAVAGRCVSPLLRSSRRKPSATLGSRSIASGAAAMAVTTTNNSKPDGARQRRQHQPQPGPGECEEQPERGRQRGQGRPQPLPQQAAARALERPRQQGPGRMFLLLWLLVQTVQKPLRRPGSRRICRRTGYHAGNSQAMRGFMRLKPIRHAIERNQLVNFKAGADHGPFARR